MPCDITDPPNGWIITTNTEGHISFLWEKEHHSLVCHSIGDPTLSNWKLKGLSGFESVGYPVYAEECDRSKAINIAMDVMKEINKKDNISPESIDNLVKPKDTDNSPNQDNEDVKNGKNNLQSTNDGSTNDKQQELTSFVE